MEPAVVVALITGSISLLVAVFSVTFTARTQAKTAKQNTKTQEKLAQLTAKLTQQGAEAAAQRDYTYEARKRLYAEVNPLFFRLRELCPGSNWRIRRIVCGEYQVTTDSEKLTDHRVQTTAQRLAGPLVVAQEIQRHMTAVDLRVDPAIKAQYLVSRELLWILHEGKVIAAVPPAISYRGEGAPDEPRQHLTFAQLQRFVDAFTKQEKDNTRPLKLNELEDRVSEKDITIVLRQLKALFASASPSSTPVLWRLLIAQASLMQVLIDLVDRSDDTVHRVLPDNIESFAWKPGGDESFKSEVKAVETFLTERLSRSGVQLGRKTLESPELAGTGTDIATTAKSRGKT